VREHVAEVAMDPFFAALVACGYMASVFVVFGLVPRWFGKAH
jgi:hypothetical protein